MPYLKNGFYPSVRETTADWSNNAYPSIEINFDEENAIQIIEYTFI